MGNGYITSSCSGRLVDMVALFIRFSVACLRRHHFLSTICLTHTLGPQSRRQFAMLLQQQGNNNEEPSRCCCYYYCIKKLKRKENCLAFGLKGKSYKTKENITLLPPRQTVRVLLLHSSLSYQNKGKVEEQRTPFPEFQ